jgi:sugar lactone lactonase YvrE
MKRIIFLPLVLALAVCGIAAVKSYRIKKVGEFPNFLALSPDGQTAYVRDR